MSGKLTTHVLDTSIGRPAAGMRVQLFGLGGDAAARTLLAEAFTNEDGRLNEPLLQGDALAEGTYELVFGVGDYFRGNASAFFLDQVPIRFKVAERTSHYHVPLLVAPGGYSTYRGS